MKRNEILMKMLVLNDSLNRHTGLLDSDIQNGDNDITVRMVKRTLTGIRKLMVQLEAFEKLL